MTKKSTVSEDAVIGYRHLDVLSACFAVVLIASNVVSVKVCQIAGRSFDAGLIMFPLAYILGDVLSEVYGYAAARRVIKTGFVLQMGVVFFLQIVQYLPSSPGWALQKSFEQILGPVPRIAYGSLVAYLCGALVNSWVLIRLKEITHGRHPWLRFFLSTVAGEAVDTVLFYPIAFYGVWPQAQLVEVMLLSYVVKVLVELPVMPISYRISVWLLQQESMLSRQRAP